VTIYARMRGMAFAPRAAAALVVAAVFASGCATASVRATAPAGEPPPPVLQVLPNGLTLIVQDHREADIVAVYLCVATGVRYERPHGLG